MAKKVSSAPPAADDGHAVDDGYDDLTRKLHRTINDYHKERNRIIANWELCGRGRKMWERIEQLRRDVSSKREEIIRAGVICRRAVEKGGGDPR